MIGRALQLLARVTKSNSEAHPASMDDLDRAVPGEGLRIRGEASSVPSVVCSKELAKAPKKLHSIARLFLAWKS